jgi:hypothetical protein
MVSCSAADHATMPLKKSNQIVLDTQGGRVKFQVRTHRIAIYSDIVSV